MITLNKVVRGATQVEMKVDPKSRKPATEPEKTEAPKPQKEIGGPKGPEPTRYNDWEKGGRCVDF